VQVAEADRDKTVQVAEAQKVRQIGVHAAQREQAVRIAELNKEQQVGEQRATFAQNIEVADADREKRIAVANANAVAFSGEAESQAKVADAEARLQVKKAEAFQLGETRRREAEAAVLEAQNRAMAKAALAEAEKVEAERRAAVEAPAKAEKARIIVAAEAESEKRRLEAEGEAAAIYARLQAEARGQYEILAKKGEGFRAMIDACGGANQAFQMLLIEHLDKLAETSAKAIANIKFDKVVVWENGGSNGQTSTASFLNGLSRTLPPMLQVLRDVAGVEIPETLVKLSPESVNGSKPSEPVMPEGR
jgi:flotillin